MDYADIFTARGTDYDRAMRAFPAARNAEFHQLVTRGGLAGGETIADVPAGGGYLKRYLPLSCCYQPHEPCATFQHGGATQAGQSAADELLPLPWRSASISVAFSLAGVHHLEDKASLFAELWRVVRPGGRLVLSDVATGSRQAVFLDDVVGTYNTTGHRGSYLTPTTGSVLEAQGWLVASDEQVACDWRFENAEALGRFCHQLFGMRKTTPQTVHAEVARHLGILQRADGGVAMPWALQTIVACKPAIQQG